MNPVEISVTCASVDEADAILGRLLEARLVACGQMWPIKSRYRWNDEVHADVEVLLQLKSFDEKFEDVARTVMELHSYEMPAVTMMPVHGASPGYVEWLADAIA